jgi:hypothetical protein
VRHGALWYRGAADSTKGFVDGFPGLGLGLSVITLPSDTRRPTWKLGRQQLHNPSANV